MDRCQCRPRLGSGWRGRHTENNVTLAGQLGEGSEQKNVYVYNAIA